jgi:hypothetical protein
VTLILALNLFYLVVLERFNLLLRQKLKCAFVLYFVCASSNLLKSKSSVDLTLTLILDQATARTDVAMSTSPLLETIITVDSDIQDDSGNQPTTDGATTITETWKIGACEDVPPRGYRMRRNRDASVATSTRKSQNLFTKEFKRHVGPLGKKRTLPQDTVPDCQDASPASFIIPVENLSTGFNTSNVTSTTNNDNSINTNNSTNIKANIPSNDIFDKSHVVKAASTQLQEAARQKLLLQEAGLDITQKTISTQSGIEFGLEYPAIQLRAPPSKKPKVAQQDYPPANEFENQCKTLFRNEVALVQLDHDGKEDVVKIKINNNPFPKFEQKLGSQIASFGLPLGSSSCASTSSTSSEQNADLPTSASSTSIQPTDDLKWEEDIVSKALSLSEIALVNTFDESLFDNVSVDDEALEELSNPNEVSDGVDKSIYIPSGSMDNLPEPSAVSTERPPEEGSCKWNTGCCSSKFTECPQTFLYSKLSTCHSIAETDQLNVIPGPKDDNDKPEEQAKQSHERAPERSPPMERKLRQKLNSRRNRQKTKDERAALEDFKSKYGRILKERQIMVTFRGILVGPETNIDVVGQISERRPPGRPLLWQQCPENVDKVEQRRRQQAINSHRNREKAKKELQDLRNFEKFWRPVVEQLHLDKE